MSLPLLSFKNVSLYPKEEFGISRASFDLEDARKYHLILPTEERKKCLLGLLEGRYKEEAGFIHKRDRFVTQSDRLLLGDRVYKNEAAQHLDLKHDFFFFDGKKRSKSGFVDQLGARHIRYFPIYKLKGTDKIKFALLSLTFQETGMVLISQLFESQFTDSFKEAIERLLQKSRCCLCCVTSEESGSDQLDIIQNINGLNTVRLGFDEDEKKG